MPKGESHLHFTNEEINEEQEENPSETGVNYALNKVNEAYSLETASHSYKSGKSQSKADNRQTAGYKSNEASKQRQKKTNKREAVSKVRKSAKTSDAAAKASKKSAEETEKAAEFIARHKKGILIFSGIAAMMLIMAGLFSTGSMLFTGVSSSVPLMTYPVEDADMLEVEKRYSEKESELREMLDKYEDTHEYDEYHFDIDAIGHDPYVLISAVTAMKGGAWKADETEEILNLLFDSQYILTEEIQNSPAPPPPVPVVTPRPEPKGTKPQRKGTVCFVTLKNFNLSHVPVHVMSHEQLSMYAVYMGCLGCRPDLFPASSYVRKYYETEYPVYDIPDEALSDERFAAMIKEAGKYLGYPYVWGGSDPETSFDCSGFVSYVCNNCGVGWNFGRLSAQGLKDICEIIPASEVKPGDLVFFEGTYDTAGASHVGIYVGGNTMLHCGDPIHYESFDTGYLRSHLSAYGRLPAPRASD